MDSKVKIVFMRNHFYDDSYFVELEELVLSLKDATTLVNRGIAVINYIYV